MIIFCLSFIVSTNCLASSNESKNKDGGDNKTKGISLQEGVSTKNPDSNS
jgi:hypothetical protein